MRSLGDRLKSHRLAKNLTQQYLADMIGVTVPTYRKIEAGDGTVEFRHVARALGVMGFGDALGNLIPEPEPELRLKDLLAPERKHASPRKRS